MNRPGASGDFRVGNSEGGWSLSLSVIGRFHVEISERNYRQIGVLILDGESLWPIWTLQASSSKTTFPAGDYLNADNDIVQPSNQGDIMTTYRVGYIIGSLSKESINRTLSKALIRLAPPELEFVEIPIKDLPLYNHDYDTDYPPEGRALKDAIAAVDALLFVTPEFNRSIPGALKNAIDWASRPWGDNSLTHKPSAVIGMSPGKIGTAIAQQSLRSVLSYCNSPQMNAPEAYIQYHPDVFTERGEVLDDTTARFLRDYMDEFGAHVARVLTVLPHQH